MKSAQIGRVSEEDVLREVKGISCSAVLKT